MTDIFAVDWFQVFVPEKGLLEIVVRGTLVYWTLFLILRFLLKRQHGVIGVADLLVLVLIADAAQNAMGNYNSIVEGAVLVLTIVFWNYAVDWLGFHVPGLARFSRPAPLLLVADGRMIREHMRQEMITEEELMSQLRQQGLDRIEDVRLCYIEGDGQVSVIRRDGGQTEGAKSKSEKLGV